MEFFGEARAHDEITILGQAGNREVADDAARPVQHRRQAEPTRLRNTAPEDVVEPGARAFARNFVLAVIRRFVKPGRAPYRLAFGAHDRKRLGTPVSRSLRRLDAIRRKPERVLKPEVGAHHRASSLETVMNRRARTAARPAVPRSGIQPESRA